MRSLARGCAAAALIVAAIVAGAGPAHADTLFQAQTAATGIRLTVTQQPASSLITASLVDDATAYTASAFDSSGGSEAQAASVFPGNLVVQGPALFCSEVFTCPTTPPDYPLLADASYPRRTQAQASANQQRLGSGPIVVAPSASTATATADGNDARTSTGGTTLLAGTPVAIAVGASAATTKVTSSATRMVTHVESTVSDVNIAGLVHIASVRAVDDITVRATGKPVDQPHVTVSGVTVAGTPASIDDRGLHVAGHDGPSLTKRIAQQGIDLRTIGTQRNDAATLARSEATGLTVTFSVPVSGLPYIPNPISTPPFDQIPGVNGNGTYVGRLTLGAVGAVAGANAEPTFALGGAFPLTSASGPTSASPVAATGAPNPLLGAPGAGGPVQAPQLAGPTQLLHGFLDGFTLDLADLYAVIALGSAALFIGWRGIAAYRRWRPAAGRRT